MVHTIYTIVFKIVAQNLVKQWVSDVSYLDTCAVQVRFGRELAIHPRVAYLTRLGHPEREGALLQKNH